MRKPVVADKDDGDRNLDRAHDIWKHTRSLSDEARTYLANRCIDIDAVPDLGGLRWHPRCPWRDATAPCIVARFINAITNARAASGAGASTIQQRNH